MPSLLRPETVSEAVRLLSDSGDGTKLVAGGTAVMLMMRAGLIQPQRLISLDRVAQLDYVLVESDTVRLGALTSLRDLERSESLTSVLPTLTAAIGLVANHRVRTRATIGGCVSEADYASDPPAVLTSFGARVRIASPRHEREVPITEFLVGYYETDLGHDEMVTEVIVPRPAAGTRTTYIKYVSRSVEDRPCVGVAVYVDADESGQVREARVVVSGATATPFILGEAMSALKGTHLDREVCRMVGEMYSGSIEPIEDVRGSSGYRRRITGRLVTRALENTLVSSRNGACRL